MNGIRNEKKRSRKRQNLSDYKARLKASPHIKAVVKARISRDLPVNMHVKQRNRGNAKRLLSQNGSEARSQRSGSSSLLIANTDCCIAAKTGLCIVYSSANVNYAHIQKARFKKPNETRSA